MRWQVMADGMRATVLAALAVCAAQSGAEQVFPPGDWVDTLDPLASTNAVPGGEISAYGGQYPQSFNYYLDNNTFTADLFSSLYERLLGMDPVTAEYAPSLAARWAISDDKRTFTFWLDPRARWSDGRPVTPDDVVWTYRAIMDPKNLTGPHKVALERLEPPVAIGTHAVRFTAREVHWENLGGAGGFSILPRHVYEGRDFNKLNFEFPVVSGPYRIGELREGVYVRLARRDDWWGWARPSQRHTSNFATLTYRFYAEQENAFEAFKKGQLDVYPVYTSRLWINETSGDRFRRNWIVKQRVRNHSPIGFQGFAMNMRRFPFDDLRVRQAMCHLLNRERMNRTIMYSQYFLHRSFYEDLYSKDAPCTNTLYRFDPQAARALLAAAGWVANPKTGLLERDGRPFSFRFLTHSSASDRFLAIYREDLRSAGIEMIGDMKDWASWSKDMEEFNFEMTWAAWSSGLFKDPESMWASKEADRRGGNNITGFKDPEVDRLIEEQKTLFDVAARHAICRRIDALVAAQCPYALLWNLDFARLLYWNKFGTPPTVLSKYGGESSAYGYWWYDADAAADLRDAINAGEFLPARPPEVDFDRVFGAH
jgi:microcin C transport system substrate-binding protein